MEIQFVKIHGHDVAYRRAGNGPEVLVFVHGIAVRTLAGVKRFAEGAQ